MARSTLTTEATPDSQQKAAGTTAVPAAPPSRGLLLLALALAAGLGFTGWLESSSKTAWRGTLETRPVVIAAPHDARIAELALSEGQKVVPGEALLRLDPGELADELSDVEQRLHKLQLKRAQAEAKAEVELAWRTKSIDAEIHQTKLKNADLLKQKYVAEMKRVAWSEFISAHGDVRTAASSPLEATLYDLALPDEARIRAMLQQEAAHNAAEVFDAEVELCEQRLNELTTLKEKLPQQVRAAEGIPLIEDEIADAERAAGTLRERLDALTITAPGYGTVGILRRRAGDKVEKGEPILELLDRKRQSVRLLVPSHDLGRFEIGRDVRVFFPGKAERRGTIASIAPQAERRNDGENFIALRIEPKGKLWPQVPFATSVDVTLDTK